MRFKKVHFSEPMLKGIALVIIAPSESTYGKNEHYDNQRHHRPRNGTNKLLTNTNKTEAQFFPDWYRGLWVRCVIELPLRMIMPLRMLSYSCRI